MTPKAFESVRNAIASIEFFRVHYASGSEFQVHFQKVLSMLREAAQNSPDYGYKKLLLGFADALDQANSPGEYRPPVKS